MLPMMILQPSDITSFDSGLDSSDLLPQEAAEPSAAFADFLELGLHSAREIEQIDGIPLPLSGKDLPPELPELPATSVVAAINVLVPQVEPARTDSQLTPASPVQFTPVAANGLLGAGSIPPAQLEAASNTAAALDPNGTGVGKVLGAAVPAALQAGAEQLLRNNPAGAASAVPQAVKPAAAADRGVAEIMRDLPAAPIAGGIDADTLDNKNLRDRSAVLQSNRMRHAASTGAAAGQSYEDVRNELPRDLRIQPGTATTPQVAQAALQTAYPLEIPAGQPTQMSVPATVSAAPAQASPETTTVATQLTQTIEVPVKDAGWGDRIGERVLLMASNRLQSAEIRLSPAELGPLRVQIAIDDGAANVTFLAQHAVTREALEQAMPRLRELLAENGLTLNQTNIGEHNEQGVQHGSRDNGDEMTAAARMAQESEDEQAAAESLTDGRTQQRADGLVDTFA